MKRKKQFVVICLSALLAVSPLYGCTVPSEEKSSESEDSKTAAMGRYLEEECTLPEGVTQILGFTQTKSNEIQIAAMGAKGKDCGIYETKDYGAAWEMKMSFPEELLGENIGLDQVLFYPDGSLLCLAADYSEMSQDQENGKIRYDLWLIDAKQKAEKLDFELGSDFYISVFASDQEKRAAINGSDGKITILDISTKKSKTFDTSAERIKNFAFSGNQLVIQTEKEILLMDPDSGKMLPKDEVLNEQLLNKEMAVSSSSGIGIYENLLEGEEDGKSIYYCSSAGLFRHNFGGTVSEMVMDGKLSSLANPEYALCAMRKLADDSFLVLAATQKGEQSLFHYVFSKDIPSVPETEIKAYALHEDPEIRQAIALFQKANPEICINLEIGVTGEDAVNVSDAVKTLNTDIMSGKGPDLLLLDGLPVQSYLEKGILEDISKLVNEEEARSGIQKGVKSCYQKDGKIYAIPTRFSIPILQGKEELLEQIEDFDSLVEVTEKQKKADSKKRALMAGMETDMIEALYEVCFPSWIKPDGSLKEESITGFFNGIKKLYGMDEHKEEGGEMAFSMASMGYGIGMSLMDYYGGKLLLNYGMVSSMDIFAELTSINQSLKDGSSFAVLNAQSEKVFLPGTTVGINSKAEQKEAALKFLSFLLSKEMQGLSQGSGFPVNLAALEETVNESTIENGQRSLMLSDEAGNMLSLDITWPSDKERAALLQYLKEAQTPSQMDQVVKEAVMEYGEKCMKGELSTEEAVKGLLQKVNLYLSE